mgnify:CR=1 FL=1
MEPMTIQELADATGATLLGEGISPDQTVTGVETDSRAVHPGDLFVALPGEKTDGHNFIPGALEAGAVACLTQQAPEKPLPGKCYLLVEDTMAAIGQAAKAYKAKFPIPVIGITGSVGKTTTKDMIAAVLSTRYRVLKTEGNYNNNIGLPLTLLRLDRSCEICVLEMGMDRPGEIDYLGEIVQPDVGVITNIGDAHIERLGSRENIFRAKCELLPHIRKENGLLILNGDDALLSTLRGRTPVPAVFCGSGEGLEYRAQSASSEGLDSLRSRLTTPAMDREVCIPALGSHMIYPTLIAAAVGEHFGLTADEIEQGIARFVPTRMRMNLVQRGNGITILDDTYNANPQSMRAAISVLADSRSAWKLAVLGDMFELGPYSPALHTGVGEYLGKRKIDCLVAVGDQARYLAEGAQSAGMTAVYPCADKKAAREILPGLIRPDSTILVKASRGMRMEELVDQLLELTPEQ